MTPYQQTSSHDIQQHTQHTEHSLPPLCSLQLKQAEPSTTLLPKNDYAWRACKYFGVPGMVELVRDPAPHEAQGRLTITVAHVIS